MVKLESYLPADEYYRLWLLLAQTKAALFKAREKHVGRRIYSNENSALVVIASLKGKATQTFLSRYFSVELSSASELVTNLEKKGLIKKKIDERRKNVVRLFITPKGNRLNRELLQTRFVRKIISHLSEDQRNQLKTCLYILLNAALEEMGEKDKLKLSIQ
jgi:DNA-binding MarR family transcriptional regulator